MDHKLFSEDNTLGNIVYVKPILVDDLPADIREEAREQADGAERLYAVHRENGEQLALVVDRDLAFSLARHHHFSPMAVH